MLWRSTTRDTSETLHERGTATVVSVVIAVHRPPARLPSGAGLPEWANTERPSQYIHESCQAIPAPHCSFSAPRAAAAMLHFNHTAQPSPSNA